VVKTNIQCLSAFLLLVFLGNAADHHCISCCKVNLWYVMDSSVQESSNLNLDCVLQVIPLLNFQEQLECSARYILCKTRF